MRVQNSLCPVLKVPETVMQLVLEDTYLGDVIRADGRNCSNVQSRVPNVIGIISQIMTILERVSFGRKYYKIAFSLREAMFLSGILTNAFYIYSIYWPLKVAIHIKSHNELLFQFFLPKALVSWSFSE